MTGWTWSADLPTRNAFRPKRSNPECDAFVLKLNAAGSKIDYATYLGGGAGPGVRHRGGRRRRDRCDRRYPLAGLSHCRCPARAALGHTGQFDAFVTKLKADGSPPQYSTFLGGQAEDQGRGIAVDAAGNAYVGGLTFSDDFPTRNPVQSTRLVDWEAFVTKVSADTAANHAPLLESIGDRAIAPGGSLTIQAAVTDPDGPARLGPTVAYDIPQAKFGNQGDHNGSLGLDFDVLADIRITHLGVFDDGANGLAVPITAYIYNRDATSTPVATLVFPAGNTGTLIGGNRFLPLATPLVLPAGFRGSVVAENYQEVERFANEWDWGRQHAPKRRGAYCLRRRRPLRSQGPIPHQLSLAVGPTLMAPAHSSSRGSAAQRSISASTPPPPGRPSTRPRARSTGPPPAPPAHTRLRCG